MSSTLNSLRILTRTSLRIPSHLRTASTTKDWEGRQPSEHATNREGLDTQSSASKSGQEDRAKSAPGTSDGGHSQATTEKDRGNQNEQAQKDHPEAPGPVIGMNDERGQVNVKLVFSGEKVADKGRWDISRETGRGRKIMRGLVVKENSKEILLATLILHRESQ